MQNEKRATEDGILAGTSLLFVDDEPHYVQLYVDGLRMRGAQVTYVTTVRAALESIPKLPSLHCVVLDIIMPPGKYANDPRAERGRRTGVLLFEEIRSTYPTLPVFFLSNVTDRQLIGYLESQPNVHFASKSGSDAWLLAGKIWFFLHPEK